MRTTAKENIQYFPLGKMIPQNTDFSVFECGNGIYGTKQTDNNKYRFGKHKREH